MNHLQVCYEWGLGLAFWLTVSIKLFWDANRLRNAPIPQLFLEPIYVTGTSLIGRPSTCHTAKQKTISSEGLISISRFRPQVTFHQVRVDTTFFNLFFVLPQFHEKHFQPEECRFFPGSHMRTYKKALLCKNVDLSISSHFLRILPTFI